MPNETDREVEQIKHLIGILARRKFIYKSELRKILSGCRFNAFTLKDLEDFMYSIIDESVSYIDDSPTSDPFRFCVVAHEKIVKAGYTDLFQLLSVGFESSLLEIAEAYRKMQADEPDSDLYGTIGLLIASDSILDIYRSVFLAREVLNELSLRKQFGLTSIFQNESDQLIGRLVEIGMDPFIAENIVMSSLYENDFVLSESKGKSIHSKEEGLDEFLIPIQNNNEHSMIKKRGLTNG